MARLPFLWAYLRVLRGYRRDDAAHFAVLARVIERESPGCCVGLGACASSGNALSIRKPSGLSGSTARPCVRFPKSPALWPRRRYGRCCTTPLGPEEFNLGGRTVRLEVGLCCAWLDRLVRSCAAGPGVRRNSASACYSISNGITSPRRGCWPLAMAAKSLRTESFLLSEFLESMPLVEALRAPDEDDRRLLLGRLEDALDQLHEAGCEADHRVHVYGMRTATSSSPSIRIAWPIANISIANEKKLIENGSFGRFMFVAGSIRQRSSICTCRRWNLRARAVDDPVEFAVVRRTWSPSLWRRFAGFRKLRQAADWEAFASADWADRIMDEEVTDRFHAKQGRSIGRWTLRDQAGRTLVVYLSAMIHCLDRVAGGDAVPRSSLVARPARMEQPGLGRFIWLARAVRSSPRASYLAPTARCKASSPSRN